VKVLRGEVEKPCLCNMINTSLARHFVKLKMVSFVVVTDEQYSAPAIPLFA
jgi:hypothetical protein